MKNLKSKTKYTATLIVAVMGMWIAVFLGCATVNTQKKSETNMEYNEIQEKVARVHRSLESEWDGSSTVILKQQTDDEPEELRRSIYAHYWRFGTSSTVALKRTAIVEFMLDKTTETF